MSVSGGVRNVSFSENCAYILSGWLPISQQIENHEKKPKNNSSYKNDLS